MDNKLQQESSSLEYFKLDVLYKITDGFSKDNKIGQGGFGTVYKGEHEGKPIAVKKLYNHLGHDDVDFKNECTILMKARHPNIIRLVGYCHDTQQKLLEKDGKYILANLCERLLCFEYFPLGSLDKALSDESPSRRFQWHECYNIIKGICMGIKYLHDINIWHLDLKPANILLDKDKTPKIGDFGLSKLIDSSQTCITQDVKGTSKYMPKEYIDAHAISEKFDVFSLGVVIIDIIGGPKGYRLRHEMSRRDFIDHVLTNWGAEVQETMLSGIQKCIELALRCGEDDRTQRPTITEIVDELNNIDIDSEKMSQMLQMHSPEAVSSSYATLKQQTLACHGMTKQGDQLRGVPVYVMLPLDTVDAHGNLLRRKILRSCLVALKSAGVAGVVVDVWWGVVQREGPLQYDWSAYLEIVERVKRAGLRLKMVLSFHQCKIGDSINISLPPWVVEEMDANQDMMYTDAEGRRNPEYISLGCDMEPVLQHRTPMQVYTDYMHVFHDKFYHYLGRVIVEIQVGMGPDGQLMYPSYTVNGWRFPGIGEFQCYDKYMNKSLQKAAEAWEEPEWADAGGPIDAGKYDEFPENTNFFRKDGEWNDEYGRFFLSWYSRKLLKHGDRLLAAAVYIFSLSSGVKLSAKVPGIHWHYDTSSHAAELTAGYYNTRHRDGYQPIIQMLHKYGAMLNFTCMEMRDYEQLAQASSSPETLVTKVGQAARQASVLLVGENALQRYDEYAFSQVVDTATRIGMSAFTYQRLSVEMFQPDNWKRFVAFVKNMSKISAKAP